MSAQTTGKRYDGRVPWQSDPAKMAYASRLQGLSLRDFESQADMARMIDYRYGRLQAALEAANCAALSNRLTSMVDAAWCQKR